MATTLDGIGSLDYNLTTIPHFYLIPIDLSQLSQTFFQMSINSQNIEESPQAGHPRLTLTSDWERIRLDQKSKSIFKRSSTDAQTEFHPGAVEFERPIQHFLTGSSYEGTWDSLGFTGFGTYYFPHGAIYHGNFKNGQFHGKGTITYPVGHKLKGVYKNGKIIDKLFVFADGLEVHEPNNYCQMPDRRFQVEFNTSLQGADNELLTNRQPTIHIPDGCYDTIDGFYVPSVKCIYNYNEDAVDQTVLPEEGEFIEQHYRKSSLDHVGFSPELYECWITGTRVEVEQAIQSMGLGDRATQHSLSLMSESSSEETSVDLDIEYLRTK